MRHKRARTAWTIVAVGLVTFCLLLLQTVSSAWRASMETRRDDRIAVWNKTTYALTLPRSYAEQVARVDGVLKASYAAFFRGVDRQSGLDGYSYTSLAVDRDYFDVYPETAIDPRALERWKQNRRGVILAEKLAGVLRYKVGDRVTIEGLTFPGTWEFEIVGTYRSQYRTFADNLFLFHWEYLSELLPEDDLRRHEINWVMALVDRSRSLEVARGVEQHFSSAPIQVEATTERSMVGQLMGSFADILSALHLIGVILVGTIALILVNMITMRLRERKAEFGILRAIGYRKGQIVTLILGEACLIGLMGGAAGIVLSALLIDRGIGPQIEQAMGAIFPEFRVPAWSLAAALILPAALAVAGSAWQAIRAPEQGIMSLLNDIE